jgi:hypothetical protein
LEAGVGISVRSADGAALHRLSSLEAVHIVTLDTVRASVRIVLIVVATTFC